MPYPSPRTIKSDNRYYSEGRTSQPVLAAQVFFGADLQACRGSESERRTSYFPLFELAGDIFMGIGLTRHSSSACISTTETHGANWSHKDGDWRLEVCSFLP